MDCKKRLSKTVIRDRKLVGLYRRGRTLRQVAQEFGITMQRVWQIIKRDRPEIMRDNHRPNFHGPRSASYWQTPGADAPR
jgi:hypothetical protein